jgi:hypothetical protein
MKFIKYILIFILLGCSHSQKPLSTDELSLLEQDFVIAVTKSLENRIDISKVTDLQILNREQSGKGVTFTYKLNYLSEDKSGRVENSMTAKIILKRNSGNKWKAEKAQAQSQEFIFLEPLEIEVDR